MLKFHPMGEKKTWMHLIKHLKVDRKKDATFSTPQTTSVESDNAFL